MSDKIPGSSPSNPIRYYSYSICQRTEEDGRQEWLWWHEESSDDVFVADSFTAATSAIDAAIKIERQQLIPKCKDCACVQLSSRPSYGYCRRHPPVFDKEEDDWSYPFIALDYDGCFDIIRIEEKKS